MPQLPTSLPTLPLTGILLDRLRAWEMPSQAEFLDQLGGIGMFQAVLLLASGLVYLLYGWKVFKILVMVNAAVLGAIVGLRVGMYFQDKGPNVPLLAACAGGVLLGLLALPLIKYAVSLMGGLAGALLGYWAWIAGCRLTDHLDLLRYAWVGSGVGLMLLGVLAFLIFRFTVIVFTSFQGAVLTITGLLAVLVQFDAPRASITAAFKADEHVLPVLVLLPAFFGLLFQLSFGEKSKPVEKG